MQELQARLKHLQDAFENRFSQSPLLVRAPGRVNLIGEHTDYNGGFVFPVAIDREMLIAVAKNGKQIVDVYSLDYEQADQFRLSDIVKTGKTTTQWSDYLRGTVSVLQKNGFSISGFSAVITGNVPQGAGLSSSAAYEVAVAVALNELFDLKISGKDIALLCQRAENEFVGVQCGIMDQFISALGEEDAALLIDCQSLESRAVPLNFDSQQLSIVITNSGVRRGLVDSEYNNRRLECAEGVRILSELLGRRADSLRDFTSAEFETYSSSLPDTIMRRCRHVISENERVLTCEKLLGTGDLVGFGELMNASHESLRLDFEVSCPELDLLVGITRNHDGVLGARMTGAGFGGCTVAIMRCDAVDSFKNNAIKLYENKSGRNAEVYVCRAAPGASCIT